MADRSHDVEERLTELARRIYQQYGTNLSAYFDALRQIEEQSNKSHADILDMCMKRCGPRNGEGKSGFSREPIPMHLRQR